MDARRGSHGRSIIAARAAVGERSFLVHLPFIRTIPWVSTSIFTVAVVVHPQSVIRTWRHIRELSQTAIRTRRNHLALTPRRGMRQRRRRSRQHHCTAARTAARSARRTDHRHDRRRDHHRGTGPCRHHGTGSGCDVDFAALSGSLIASGATFPKGFYDEAIAKLADIAPDLTIEYGGGGSGKGRTDLQEQVVDFAGTDGVVKEEDIAKFKGGEFVYVPDGDRPDHAVVQPPRRRQAAAVARHDRRRSSSSRSPSGTIR